MSDRPVAALVRRPSPRLSEGLVTHIERTPLDLERAEEQWTSYVDVLHGARWRVEEVAPADDCPDGVFVEDAVVMVGPLAIVCRPGAEERRAETASVMRAVEALGYDVHRISSPGTLDGGDVLKVADARHTASLTIYVGASGRTNQEGIRQLRSLVAPLGHRVVPVETTRVLHLKSAVTALPDGTIIGYVPLVDDPGVYPAFLPVPEPAGAHVVALDSQRLLLSARAPRTAELLAGRGYEPVLVDIDEFERLEGCVTCLSVRLRHGPQTT